MKCGAYVLYKISGKKNLKRKVVECFPRSTNQPLRHSKEMYEICDGDVTPQVILESDGDCSCCSTHSIVLQYKCNKCGSVNFPELPSSEDELNELLRKITLITDEERESYIEAYKQREVEWQQKLNDFRSSNGAKKKT